MAEIVKLRKVKAMSWKLNEIFAAVFTLRESKEAFMPNLCGHSPKDWS